LPSSCPFVHLSLCMEQLGSHRKGFDEILCFRLFLKSVEEIKVLLKCGKITGTLHKDEMFQIKFVEKIKIHNLCSVTFFRKSCRLWDNVKKITWSQRTQIMWGLRVAYWISKLTRAQARLPPCAHTQTHPDSDTRTQQNVLLIDLPQQQWLRESASLLRYTYIACIVVVLETNQ
jgi:hypothetical protein